MSQITSLSQLDLSNENYTYADYLSWKFEQAVELIKGKIFPMSGPSRRHQGLSREINGIFYNHFKNNIIINNCHIIILNYNINETYKK